MTTLSNSVNGLNRSNAKETWIGKFIRQSGYVLMLPLALTCCYLDLTRDTNLSGPFVVMLILFVTAFPGAKPAERK